MKYNSVLYLSHLLKKQLRLKIKKRLNGKTEHVAHYFPFNTVCVPDLCRNNMLLLCFFLRISAGLIASRKVISFFRHLNYRFSLCRRYFKDLVVRNTATAFYLTEVVDDVLLKTNYKHSV